MELNARSISDYRKDYAYLSDKQISVINDAYKFGEKHNLGYSLAAIVWQESNAGELQVSMIGNDYGVCQININTYLRRFNIKDTSRNRSKYATKLILDTEHNYLSAVKELKFWISQKKLWESYKTSVWAKYNGGHKGNNAYGEEIFKRIQILRENIK